MIKNLSSPAIFLSIVLAGCVSANFIFASERIDINTAPPKDLVRIIHIGEARALELISLRPFSSLDDLAKIKGIGEKRIEDIKNQGLAWVEISESGSLKTETLETEEIESGEKLAAIGEQLTEQLPRETNRFVVLLVAAIIAVFSGITILFLKKRVKMYYNKKI